MVLLRQMGAGLVDTKRVLINNGKIKSIEWQVLKSGVHQDLSNWSQSGWALISSALIECINFVDRDFFGGHFLHQLGGTHYILIRSGIITQSICVGILYRSHRRNAKLGSSTTHV